VFALNGERRSPKGRKTPARVFRPFGDHGPVVRVNPSLSRHGLWLNAVIDHQKVERPCADTAGLLITSAVLSSTTSSDMITKKR
jgi:hypothetical protein